MLGKASDSSGTQQHARRLCERNGQTNTTQGHNTDAATRNAHELVRQASHLLQVSEQVRIPPSELSKDTAPESTATQHYRSGQLFTRRNDVLYSVDELRATSADRPSAASGDGPNNNQTINPVTHHTVNGSHERCDLTDYVTVKSGLQRETYSPKLSNHLHLSGGGGRGTLFVMGETAMPLSLPLLTLDRNRTQKSGKDDQGKSSTNSERCETRTVVTTTLKPATMTSAVNMQDKNRTETHLGLDDNVLGKTRDPFFSYLPQEGNSSNDESTNMVDSVDAEESPDAAEHRQHSDITLSCPETTTIDINTDLMCLPGKEQLAEATASISQVADGSTNKDTPRFVPPPPAPPPPPNGPAGFSHVVSPSKPKIHPRVKMRPLFWKKIVLEETTGDNKPTNFWSLSEEPTIDATELERLFGGSSSVDSEVVHLSASLKAGKGKQVGKVLEDKRSRDVAIKISRLQMTMEEVQEAIYKMDAKKLDVDRLQGLYNMRATEKELAEIKRFKQENKNDKPEEFLLQLAEVHSLQDRLECWIFTERFSETMFNLHQQMNSLMSACSKLKHSDHLHAVLRLVLAAGNYMNGNTPRGQADGYQLDILTKLRDVRTKDKTGNLLQYLVRLYCRRSGDVCDADGQQFKLPTPELMKTARQTSLKDSRATVHGMSEGLKRVKALVQKVQEECEASMVTSFRCKMKPFVFHAELTLKRETRKLDEVEDAFQELLEFFDCKEPDMDNPSAFFEIWERFCQDFNECWMEEQKRLAKEMFHNVENDKKARRNSTTTRELTDCSKGALLKARFSRQNSQTDLQDGANIETATTPDQNGTFAKEDTNTADTYDSPTVNRDFTSANQCTLYDRSKSGNNSLNDCHSTVGDMSLLNTINECQVLDSGCRPTFNLGNPDNSISVSESYSYLADESSFRDDKGVRKATRAKSEVLDDATDGHEPSIDWVDYAPSPGLPTNITSRERRDSAVRVSYQGSTLVVSL